ncbi:MAG: hypothetical protein V1861_02160 [Candidatus Micrarchaeota archaeon]
MASEISKLTGHNETVQEKKRGFRPFAAMAEGLRMRKARRGTLEALETAMRFFGESECFGEAVSSFTALPKEQKERVLLEMQKSLKSVSYLPFEDEHKTRCVATIGEFFAKAAVLLPVDSEGERITAPYKETVRILKEIVERDELRRSGNPSHSRAILACAKALWELEYGNFSFWEGRALDSATRDYTITKLLEMPDTSDITEHGWFLLRKHLAELGTFIAKNPSPKKEDFFRSMLMDGDKSVVASALKCAVCMEQIPSDYYGIAGDLSKIPGLESAAQNFTMAGRFKEQLAGAGEDRLVAAKRLAVFYADGMVNLEELLDRTAREMVQEALYAVPGSQDRLKHLDVLVNFASVGIAPYSPGELIEMLGPLTTTRSAVATFYNLTQNLMAFSPRQDLKNTAAELESARVNSCFSDLSYADERQFDAANELVLLYSTGRVYLVENGMIAHLAKDMVEIILEPPGETKEQRDAQVGKAKNVIDNMRRVGIDVQINYEQTEAFPDDGSITDGGVDGGPDDVTDGGSETDGGVSDE